MLNLKRKEFDQALRTIAKLEAAQSDNTLALPPERGCSIWEKGDVGKARAQFERALKIDPALLPGSGYSGDPRRAGG
jgi:hypothetical protein